MSQPLSDGSTFAIRPARTEDADTIVGFIRELAQFEKLGDQVRVTAADLRKTLFSEPRYAEVLLAERDGTPVGFALYFFNFSTFLGKPGLYLEDLYVRPTFRSLGIGRRLLARLAEIAESRGCGRFEWSVLDWNEDAIRFYKMLGAAPVKGWTVHRLVGDALTALARLYPPH